MFSDVLQKITVDSSRAWLVGDIHGQYNLLMATLKQKGFSAGDGDILISVGDMVDRGPDSVKTLQLLKEDWFYAVMGNHEQLLLKGVAALDGKGNVADILNWQTYNGGNWYSNDSAHSKDVKALIDKIATLPLAIELQTESGSIGVIHAAVPDNRWLDELALAQEFGTKHALWHRDNGLVARRHQSDPTRYQATECYAPKVTGVDKVVVGHTIMTEGAPVLLGNTLYLDVGAANGAAPAVIRADEVLKLSEQGAVSI